jgi:hypothetical protein
MQYIEEDILLINEAFNYLVEGEILVSIDSNSSLFKLKDNKVLIVNKNYKSYITKEEFVSLYKEVKFIIYNPKDSDLVDEIKDKEYYSWTHK